MEDLTFSVEQIIREYWDTEYFTVKELEEQGTCICERNFGDELRVGIMVKQEDTLYHVVVRGIEFCLSKIYDTFPTLEVLIEDFNHLLDEND